MNRSIKEIVKSIHQNLSEDKPDEKQNVLKFKEKRANLVKRFVDLLDKMKGSNTNWIGVFESEINNEKDEFERLKTLKGTEKELNDMLKQQTRQIKEKNAEKMRLKLESEEKVRKEKDKVNKLKAKYAMSKQADETEYRSVLETNKNNNAKKLEEVDRELAELDRQESMYKATEEYMKKQVTVYKDSEGQVRKERFEAEKNSTTKKITELETKVRTLTEEVDAAVKKKEE